jgi:hypothetical protein
MPTSSHHYRVHYVHILPLLQKCKFITLLDIIKYGLIPIWPIRHISSTGCAYMHILHLKMTVNRSKHVVEEWNIVNISFMIVVFTVGAGAAQSV